MLGKTMPFSGYGVPLLGLTGLLVCLWHPQVSMQAATGQDIYFVQPSPRLDPSMTVFLRQEAKNVAYSRTHDGPAMQAKAIASYNIIARECTPAVFKATHLPASW